MHSQKLNIDPRAPLHCPGLVTSKNGSKNLFIKKVFIKKVFIV